MNMDRRTFVAGAAGLAVLSSTGFPGQAFAARIGAVGLQLFTVRDIFAADPVGTLEKVARIGYREVEYGGGNYDRMDHELLRRTMDRLKLAAPSIHVPYEMLLDRFEAAVTMAKTLGAATVVLPFMTPDRRTEAAWNEALPNIARIGEKLHKAGLGFAYHNHDFEFTTKPGGISLYDRLVKAVDPALMQLELDLYWAIHAGEKAADLIQRFGPRLYAFHVKDMRADGSMAAVGAGTIDFAALFRLSGAAGVCHYYVENDQAPAPYIPDITKSFQTLRALRF